MNKKTRFNLGDIIYVGILIFIILYVWSSIDYFKLVFIVALLGMIFSLVLRVILPSFSKEKNEVQF